MSYLTMAPVASRRPPPVVVPVLPVATAAAASAKEAHCSQVMADVPAPVHELTSPERGKLTTVPFASVIWDKKTPATGMPDAQDSAWRRKNSIAPEGLDVMSTKLMVTATSKAGMTTELVADVVGEALGVVDGVGEEVGVPDGGGGLREGLGGEGVVDGDVLSEGM